MGSTNIGVRAYLNNDFIGEVIKSNFTTDSIIQTGMAYSIFVYVDRPFTYKGTNVENTSNNHTFTSVYNVTFKKGWNEVVYKITSIVNQETTSASYKNIISSDLQWHFFKTGYSGIHGKLPEPVKAEKIFR